MEQTRRAPPNLSLEDVDLIFSRFKVAIGDSVYGVISADIPCGGLKQVSYADAVRFRFKHFLSVRACQEESPEGKKILVCRSGRRTLWYLDELVEAFEPFFIGRWSWRSSGTFLFE
jgi:hypothetical protein